MVSLAGRAAALLAVRNAVVVAVAIQAVGNAVALIETLMLKLLDEQRQTQR